MSRSSALPSSLILVGAGKMGGAMLEGWLNVGLSPDRVTVLDPHPSAELSALCDRNRIDLNPTGPGTPEVLVLAVKPQLLDAAAATANALVGGETLVVSILAGKTIADLQARLPRARAIVRAMPNLPASIGRGATGACANEAVTARQRETADALLSAVGIVEWVDREDLIDAVTAVSGSGPAYVFHLVECLAEAGAAAGLPEELATRLARATVSGAGALLEHSELAPGRLRENVTSPGGTTAAALEVLMRRPSGMPDQIKEAVAAAKRRAGELSG
ncbi:pyrroline-5-carboxylate reductase [Microvirga massiliensis]|uniref:pyrroline-5-carboxylate reductase n=1 Tax=Microvirga massiliensis TaxID=1033741 RepID=UPI00062B7ABA|nr:pyrroline-5-carboxylate reductase [Microvirga massiliensis]